MIAFPDADYYDCRDSGVMEHETPEDAIEGYVDSFLTPDCDVEATIRAEVHVLIVSCHRRKAVGTGWVKDVARDLVEGAVETFVMEFGDPDWDLDSDFVRGSIEAAEAAIDGLFRVLYEGSTVWRRETVGSVELSVDHVIEMMKTCRPDWFEGNNR